MVICYRPVQPFLTKAPSLIFEVLSAASAEKDRRTKYAIYEREGVTYYVIVDPENEVAKVFRLRDGRYILRQTIIKPHSASLWAVSPQGAVAQAG